MGKGDKKTRRGKIRIGSYWNTRPRKVSSKPVINKSRKKKKG
jgi:ribosomal small subunit protein bTHX